jgi:hypothetical protein
LFKLIFILDNSHFWNLVIFQRIEILMSRIQQTNYTIKT